MSENRPKLGAGNVEIVLDGEKLILKPSLKAALALSSQPGAIAGVVQAVSDFNLQAMATVVSLASGNDAEEAAEAIFATGMVDLAPPIVRFLTMLANGGRPVAGGSGKENPPKENR
jgi:hypothetical protein